MLLLTMFRTAPPWQHLIAGPTRTFAISLAAVAVVGAPLDAGGERDAGHGTGALQRSPGAGQGAWVPHRSAGRHSSCSSLVQPAERAMPCMSPATVTAHPASPRPCLPQTVAFCGVFPEIKRAWATVDNSLFLWRFDKWCVCVCVVSGSWDVLRIAASQPAACGAPTAAGCLTRRRPLTCPGPASPHPLCSGQAGRPD